MKNQKKTTKRCPRPDCDHQVPTACKACYCGHAFRKAASPEGPEGPQDAASRRRTDRVKKEPHYFNAMEYESHFKRRRRTISASSTSGEDSIKKKRGRPRASIGRIKPEPKAVVESTPSTPTGTDKEKEKERERDEDLYSGLPVEKALQYSIILAELNRKYTTQNFNPS